MKTGTVIATAVEKKVSVLKGASVNVRLLDMPAYMKDTHQVTIITKGAILKAKVDINYNDKTPLVVRNVEIVGMANEKGTNILLEVIAEKFAAHI